MRYKKSAVNTRQPTVVCVNHSVQQLPFARNVISVSVAILDRKLPHPPAEIVCLLVEGFSIKYSCRLSFQTQLDPSRRLATIHQRPRHSAVQTHRHPPVALTEPWCPGLYPGFFFKGERATVRRPPLFPRFSPLPIPLEVGFHPIPLEVGPLTPAVGSVGAL